ncbi:Serine/threonine-protein phosphatase 2A activator 1 [Daldinia childiae]|uniref:Serine/threonine-protein phosphatase 2A activator 1 n=1 Tax=Daldinia childiae TaxID=326645 RepID=UPI0014461AEB|nr:Serine/threonine-protein phosphatase 2A activator 1 [Daldinia childiae]KAF3062456.1 Serine/threonine-protein phosphatase 2A activator 1 [Daldinia childiae]
MTAIQGPQQSQGGANSFPVLEIWDPSKKYTFIKPTKQINDGPDVARFLTTKAYRDIGIFVMQLNRAMCPRKSVGDDGKDKIIAFHIGSEYETRPVQSVLKLQELLVRIESYIDEAPPDQGPRRFGNVSFRKWYKLLEGRVVDLLEEFLPASVLNFGHGGESDTTSKDELTAYLLGGFGSPQRLDYGTGHELSFLAFLGGLWKLGAFKDGKPGGDIERSIVLGIFEPYLRVVRRLILTYTLEPAGSHGVWGLDDHSFQPYIYGSAQLSRAITDSEPMPIEGSLFRAPKPAQVVKAEYVEQERNKNMYFSAIGFINDVKKGPFWEHSPILFDISGIKDGWGKINKGMIKMFNAEVLSKFPVVQHFPFGSLFSWEQDPNAAAPQQSIHMANQPPSSTSMPPPTAAIGSGTAAPWAQTTNMPPPSGPGIPYSRAPWGPGHPVPRPSQPRTSTPGTQSPITQAPWTKSSDRPSG